MEIKLTVAERMNAQLPIYALSGRCSPALVRQAIEALDALEFAEDEQVLYGIREEEENLQCPQCGHRLDGGRRATNTVWDPEHAGTETTMEMKPATAKWLAGQVLAFAGWSPSRALPPLFDKMQSVKEDIEKEYGQMEGEGAS